MSWDVTQDVGVYDVGAEESIMMECDGWELTKTWWALGCDNDYDEPMLWANHVECEKSRPPPHRGQHFPRDNAIVGFCTYCGAKCPEHFQTLFKLFNWKWIADWSKTAQAFSSHPMHEGR
jgi:hypothetical protein